MPPSATDSCLVINTPPSRVSPPGFLEDVRAELDLTRAYIQSAEMGTVTPLLKQELRYKIQARRLSEGRTELSVSETKRKPVEDKLTVEDIRKKIIRQNQNKESSRRVRQRQIVQEDKLWKRINTISAHNNKLRRIRSALLEEKESILKQFKDISCDVLMTKDISCDVLMTKDISCDVLMTKDSVHITKVSAPLSAETPNTSMASPPNTSMASPPNTSMTSPPNTCMTSHPKAAIIVLPPKTGNKILLSAESSSKGMLSISPESSNMSTVILPQIRHMIMVSPETQ
ncbi:uncharacterized protein LOC117339472 isoform X3 [Pecten maximus]|uniref:uncharacterized protein LOC117339472 isoform X2 n=1 Tax=Pecten maximus TaxID=6579 RepID=UPI001458AB85|nr:uncharacterized protein LOC117339472 isoform X2 [Pecten maximus]XP_033757013.1 uncharacterized protein LOC117339472 isoform X3 [Pecten maximus]